MYRSHNNGSLRASDINTEVTLSGWVQKSRDKGFMKGTVIERASKNPNIPTGDIEILVSKLTVLNEALVPPFTIEDETDGGEDVRMKYRYLDIRRNPVKDSLIFRHKVAMEVRKYL